MYHKQRTYADLVQKGLLKCHYCEKEQQKDNIKLI